MREAPTGTCRYYLTYSGVKLPLSLMEELPAEKLGHRITYFCGYYDEAGRMTALRKMVYGEIEMEHRYHYDENGVLRRAEVIDMDEEVETMAFDEQGNVLK
jgi:hypothetical protein